MIGAVAVGEEGARPCGRRLAQAVIAFCTFAVGLPLLPGFSWLALTPCRVRQLR